MPTLKSKPKPRKTYLALVRRFPLRPIRSEAALDRATAVINSLLDQGRLNSDQADYLDVLSDLVQRFENEAHAIATDDLTEGEMLAFMMEQQMMSQAELARETGIAVSTISEILAGKRDLTRSQIIKLGQLFHVNPGIFLPTNEHQD